MENKKPDWRIKDDYKYVSSSSLSEIEFYAWQFLRRNPEYQRDYEKELAKYYERERNTPPDERGFGLFWGLLPEDPNIAAKWGLQALINPNENSPFILFDRKYGRLILGKNYRTLIGYPEEYESVSESMVPDNKVAIVFEMRLAITPQIKFAKKKLIEFQKEIKKTTSIKIKRFIKPRVSLWRDFLRVYDAYTEGIKRKEIASIIFPKDKNIYPNYNASKKVASYKKKADKLINGGYKKEILIWNRPFPPKK